MANKHSKNVAEAISIGEKIAELVANQIAHGHSKEMMVSALLCVAATVAREPGGACRGGVTMCCQCFEADAEDMYHKVAAMLSSPDRGGHAH